MKYYDIKHKNYKIKPMIFLKIKVLLLSLLNILFNHNNNLDSIKIRGIIFKNLSYLKC